MKRPPWLFSPNRKPLHKRPEMKRGARDVRMSDEHQSSTGSIVPKAGDHVPAETIHQHTTE
jgi:hypothetical protein